MAFKLFKHKSSGVVASYPEHYADHPVFGADLELLVEETEVDKVVSDDHSLPLEQRITYMAEPGEASEDDFDEWATDDEEID